MIKKFSNNLSKLIIFVVLFLVIHILPVFSQTPTTFFIPPDSEWYDQSLNKVPYYRITQGLVDEIYTNGICVWVVTAGSYKSCWKHIYPLTTNKIFNSPQAVTAITPDISVALDNMVTDKIPQLYAVDSGYNRVLYNTYNDCLLCAEPQKHGWNSFGSYGEGEENFKNPYGITAYKDGNIYIADTYNHRISKWKNYKGTITHIRNFGSWGDGQGQLKMPMAVTIDNYGNIFVADTGNNRIQVFSPSGAFVRQWGSFGSDDGKFSMPSGIHFRNGNVYVSDTGNRRIQMFNSNGGFIKKVELEGNYGIQNSILKGLDTDSSGNLYVVDENNSKIYKFDKDLNFITSIGTQGTQNPLEFNHPRGIAIHKAAGSRVFITEETGGQYYASGSDLKEFSVSPKTFSPKDPLKNKAEITYEITGESYIELGIWKNENLIKKIVEPNFVKSTGKYTVSWNGQNDNGDIVTDGEYKIKIILRSPYWLNDDGTYYKIKEEETTVTVGDTIAPTSTLTLPTFSSTSSFSVNWSATDDKSGIAYYDIQYQTQDYFTKNIIQDWTTWLANTTNTQQTFTGSLDKIYTFRVRACDKAGNCENFSEEKQKSIEVYEPYYVLITTTNLQNQPLTTNLSIYLGTLTEVSGYTPFTTTYTSQEGRVNFTLPKGRTYTIMFCGDVKYLPARAVINTTSGDSVARNIRIYTSAEGGDLNRDGIVNLMDFYLMKSTYGKCLIKPSTPQSSNCMSLEEWQEKDVDGVSLEDRDLNKDGKINLADVVILLKNYKPGTDSLFCLIPPKLPSSRDVALTLEPSIRPAKVGEVIKTKIQFNSEYIIGGQVSLNFDPKILQVVDEQGNPTTTLTKSATFDQVILNEVDNENGIITYAAARLQVLDEIRGANLVEINFKKIAEGDTEIKISPTTPPQALSKNKLEIIVNTKGQEIKEGIGVIYLSPSAKTVGAGEIAKLDIIADAPAPVDAVFFKLKFNTEHLEIVDENNNPVCGEIETTKLLGNMTSFGQIPMVECYEENGQVKQTGTINYVGALFFGYTSVPLKIATLNFKVKKDDFSTLYFYPEEEQFLSFTGTDNYIAKTQGASVGNTPDIVPPTITNLSATPSTILLNANQKTAINFNLSEPGLVEVKIKDENQNLVRTFVPSLPKPFSPLNPVQINWDGSLENLWWQPTEYVPDGIYTIEVSATDWAANTTVATTKVQVSRLKIENLQITNIARRKATLNFITNLPAKTKINYGEDLDYGYLKEEDQYLTTHTIELTENLQPGRTYHYYLELSTQEGAKLLTEEDYTFTTLAKPTGNIIINNGEKYTNNTSVQLSLQAQSVAEFYIAQMRIRNQNSYQMNWEDFLVTKQWELTSGEGIKEVTVQYKDNNNEDSGYYSDTIILDTTPPIAPTISATSFNYPNVLLTWQPAADNYEIAHYKILRSALPITEETKTTAEVIADVCFLTSDFCFLTSGFSFTDTTGTAGQTYFYAVTSVDGAGNESMLSNIATAKVGTITGNIVGPQYTNTPQITINNNVYGVDNYTITKMQFSNDGEIWSDWEDFTQTKEWTLSENDGEKIIYAKFKDNEDYVNGPFIAKTIYDTTPPTANFTAEVIVPKTIPHPYTKLEFAATDNLSGVDYINVYRSEEPITQDNKQNAMLLLEKFRDSSYTDYTVDQGHTYYYLIEVYDRATNKALSTG
ncbi:hypothetical protein M1437_01895, partial [Patescibacteria group bacterium]|nr:hypothetical protein [Patescibacteria group bacterium]